MTNKILFVAVAVLLIVVSFFAGYSFNKSTPPPTEAQNLQNQIDSLKQQNAQLQEEVNRLQSGNVENTRKVVLNGAFTISCPGGVVCDENFDYRAYVYQDENLWIYFSFNPSIVNNYNLQAFKDNFNYANIKLNFPEKSFGSTEAYYQNLNPIREIRLISYENNILSGELDFAVDKITKRTPGDCVYGGIAGWCYADENVDYSYTLEFHMEIPS